LVIAFLLSACKMKIAGETACATICHARVGRRLTGIVRPGENRNAKYLGALPSQLILREKEN
jgi:hypothetical protein